jgi:hypothetical protein
MVHGSPFRSTHLRLELVQVALLLFNSLGEALVLVSLGVDVVRGGLDLGSGRLVFCGGLSRSLSLWNSQLCCRLTLFELMQLAR